MSKSKKSFKNPDIGRSEIEKYQDTMMADMGLLSLDELSADERKRWKKALMPSREVKKKLKEMGYSLYTNDNKRSLGHTSLMSLTKLASLKDILKKSGHLDESLLVDRLIKISSIPGIDSPSEEVDIEDVTEAIDHLGENPGLILHLDNPKGTFKWTIDGEKRPMPFHYGEVIEANNPSDDMGWDVVIAPEATDESQENNGVHYIPAGHDLQPVGYIPVNPDKELWAKNTSTDTNPEGKEPPIGNDKIILAPKGRIKKDDALKIEDFFGEIWNFKDIVWL
jgi:hypothetical protein